MKAAVIERPGELVVRQVPMPEPGEYDALCELLYGATCTGTDQHLIAGRFPWPVEYPTILGHESIGRVVAVGLRVRHLQVGDLVTRVGAPPSDGLSVNWGGFAEYGIARDHWVMAEDGRPPAEWHGYRVNQILPAGTDPRAATLFITWRETLSYSLRMGVGAGAAVLVIGSGGNGLSFTAHAANLGASEVVMVGSAGRAGQGRAAGATVCLDYRLPDWLDRCRERSPQGFDFIIDAVGKRGALDAALPLLRAGGTVGIYGIDDFGACTVNPTHARGTFTFYGGGYDEPETHERVLAFFAQGRLRAEVWLDLEHAFPLAAIGQAFAAVRERKTVKALVRLHSASQ